jgi:hypothetical protein
MGNHVADASPLQLSKRRPDFAHLNERVNSACLAHGTLTTLSAILRNSTEFSWESESHAEFASQLRHLPLHLVSQR